MASKASSTVSGAQASYHQNTKVFYFEAREIPFFISTIPKVFLEVIVELS
jgi:hypothetical protein